MQSLEYKLRGTRREVIGRYRELQRQALVEGFCKEFKQLSDGKKHFTDFLTEATFRRTEDEEERLLAYNFAQVLFEAISSVLFKE
jgi:hypothetical protein